MINSEHKSFIVLFSFLCLNIFLLVYSLNAAIPFAMTMWASGILWLNSIPVFHYVITGHKREIFPYIAILGSFITLTYSLPVFFIKASSYEVAPLTESALAYAFKGYFIFYLCYFLLSGFMDKRKCFNIITIPVTDFRIRALAWVFILIYFFTNKFFNPPSFSYIGAAGIYIYLGTYIFLLVKKIKISFAEKIIYYTILAEELITSCISGQFAGFALLALYLCIIYYVTGRRFGKILLLSIIFVVF